MCNWHANCRNVHQSCCQIIEWSFLYHKLPSNVVLKNLAVRLTSLTTADRVYGVVWVSGLPMSTLWTEFPMVEVGVWYCRHKLRTMNTIAFYRWPFECPLSCHSSAVCSSYGQYPATSHSHRRGVGQHSAGHNRQPDQLWCDHHLHEASGDHQMLTGFLIHNPTFFVLVSVTNRCTSAFPVMWNP